MPVVYRKCHRMQRKTPYRTEEALYGVHAVFEEVHTPSVQTAVSPPSAFVLNIKNFYGTVTSGGVTGPLPPVYVTSSLSPTTLPEYSTLDGSPPLRPGRITLKENVSPETFPSAICVTVGSAPPRPGCVTEPVRVEPET